MRRLIHISDLHFGRTRPELVKALKESIRKASPEVLIVSGDLTQRARQNEFMQACDFIQSFNCNKIVVPGNHDVPLFNLFSRFFNPYKRYKKCILNELNPFFEDDVVAIQGLTTAHAWTIAGGKLHSESLSSIRPEWKEDHSKIKIFVTHHPFEQLTTKQPTKRWGYRSDLPVTTILEAQPDMVLSGHLHRTDFTSSSEILEIAHKAVVCVQAGSAVSTRLRGEENSFNSISLTANKICIERMIYSEDNFIPASLKTFKKIESGWIPA